MDNLPVLSIIRDQDFGLTPHSFNNPFHHFGVRGLIFDSLGQIALVRKQNVYKLVGSGIDDTEKDPAFAFKKLALDEIGYSVDVDSCIGVIDEYRTMQYIWLSTYVYIAHIVSLVETKNQDHAAGDDGLVWLSINEAIEAIRNSEAEITPSNYSDIYPIKFIVRRDLEILNYYLAHRHELQAPSPAKGN